jgi:hypothetical protein
MADMLIYDDFDFYIDPAEIKGRIKIDDEDIASMIGRYCLEAQETARPKAAMAVFPVQRKEGSVDVGEVTFESRLLSENLSETQKVVIYILTCGTEIYEWAKKIDGYLESYIAEEIKISALLSASCFLNDCIKKNVFPEKSSNMNPGSLEDWPLTEQKKLFRLMDSAARRIGVELKESCLMIPDKSVSGIIFQKEKSFVNCMLCKRENCPDRRAEYRGEQT